MRTRPAGAFSCAAPALSIRGRGLRGVKPLTDKDRNEVRTNLDEKVLGAEPIGFGSSAVEPSETATYRCLASSPSAGKVGRGPSSSAWAPTAM